MNIQARSELVNPAMCHRSFVSILFCIVTDLLIRCIIKWRSKFGREKRNVKCCLLKTNCSANSPERGKLSYKLLLAIVQTRLSPPPQFILQGTICSTCMCRRAVSCKMNFIETLCIFFLRNKQVWSCSVKARNLTLWRMRDYCQNSIHGSPCVLSPCQILRYIIRIGVSHFLFHWLPFSG